MIIEFIQAFVLLVMVLTYLSVVGWVIYWVIEYVSRKVYTLLNLERDDDHAN